MIKKSEVMNGMFTEDDLAVYTYLSMEIDNGVLKKDKTIDKAVR